MSADIRAVLENVSVRRGRRWIVRDVSLELRERSITAIIGPNGSGKSTIARLLAGQLWPTEGTASIVPNGDPEPAAVVKQLTRLVQPAAPLDFDPSISPRQIILTGFFGTLQLYDKPTRAMVARTRKLLEVFSLTAVADSQYGLLSTGEKVRTLIARALAIRPKLLILDEPTNGLDLLAREQVLMTISRIRRSARDMAIVLITHHVEELPPETSQVLILREGQVFAQGTPAEALRDEAMSKAYGIKVEVHRRQGRFYTTVHPRAWSEI